MCPCVLFLACLLAAAQARLRGPPADEPLPNPAFPPPPRRQLSVKSLDRRRVVSVEGSNMLYQLDDKQTLMPINSTGRDLVPFSGYWFDDDEIIVLSRENVSLYHVGKSVYNSLYYLPNAVRGPLAMSPSPLDADICPCGENFVPSRRSLSTLSEEQEHPAGEEANICVLDSSIGRHFVSYLSRDPPLRFKYTMVSSSFASFNYRMGQEKSMAGIEGCSLLLQVLPEHQTADLSFCPETCLPVPFVSLPSSVLLSSSWGAHEGIASSTLLLCSLTWSQLPRPSYSSIRASSEALLHLLLMRRREECRDGWYTSALPRRQVHGLLLLVGGRGRWPLLKQQFSTLSGQDPHSSTLVAGWGAIEDIYPCSRGTRCVPTISENHYRLYMPSTSVTTNRDDNPGWVCAQRRPLRALAHALLLFDANYVLLGDDDTYTSRHLLFSGKFNAYIARYVMQQAIVVGDLHLSNRDVTRFGFRWGGSGYLFGRPVLQALTAKVLTTPRTLSTYWSGPMRTKALNVFYEARLLAARNCPACLGPTSHLPATEYPVGNYTVNLSAHRRMIDVCNHLMSGEDSCYHSDHALSRCFIHGAAADFVHVSSHLTTLGEEGLILGMNFYGSFCDPFVHLTCHRHVANASNPFQPIHIPAEDIHHYYPSRV